MTIRLRFALLIGLFIAGLILTTLGLRIMERAERGKMLEAERQTRAQLLSHWIDFSSRALPQFVSDLAQSEEIAGLLALREADLLRQKLQRAMAATEVSLLWILHADGTVALRLATSENDKTPLPLAVADLTALVAQTPSPRFFAEHNGDLLEVCIRRASATRGAGAEWLVAARRWDQAQLNALESLTETRITLRPSHEVVQTPGDLHRIVLVRPLNDWQGHPLRVLRFEAEAIETGRAIQADWRQVQIFAVFGLLVIAGLALALQRWIIQPLSQISESLGTGNPQAVATLTAEKSELGRIAQLVVASFTQRHALQAEIAQRSRAQEELRRSEEAIRHNLEERARLGRDLHDGIIQSLYAAGMSLAGIRTLLQPEQAEAEMRLEQTRSALNETIHDVRNFIIGLEPEALKRQTFSQAVGALLEAMRGMQQFQSTVAIDEALASRLTLAQRVHALQIAREAISNALRHGAAKNIHVALQTAGRFVEFEVADDGAGFDTSSAVARGKGLANFVQRARELGAELAVESHPGRGTCVKLTFSLLIL